MDKEICTISIGNGFLDNDYTFYESGKIKNFYDQSQYKLNQTSWITPNQISESKKVKILEKCSESNREFVEKILRG
ncbi:MAG: hypothetical protein Crog4KO_13530 [Crocinitomicaceae bacterium]